MDKPTELTDVQKQILEGHLLGDGYLTLPKRGKNALFAVKRSRKDEEYLLWTAYNFPNFICSKGILYSEQFHKKNQKKYYFIQFASMQLPIFTEYHKKWYPKGNKIVPRDLVLTPLTIAVWFCDDGCLCRAGKNNLSLEFSTRGFDYNDVVFLQENLVNLYGNNIRITEVIENQFVIKCSKNQTIYNILDGIIPCFPPLSRKFRKLREDDSIRGKINNNNFIKFDQIQLYQKEKLPNCIYCHSNNIIKNGFKLNKQSYECKNCKKTYFELKDYKILPKEYKDKLPNCIYCGSSNNKPKSHTVKDYKPIYYCKDCKKQYMNLKDYVKLPSSLQMKGCDVNG